MFAWICPVCSSLLNQQAASWFCSNNHNYDKAKEGYVNLLLANQKSSKLPGDAPEMLKARREFLGKGFYDPIASALLNLVDQSGATLSADTPIRLIDCGCGEGYYLNYLQKNLTGPFEFAGLDIAKHGVRLAAKKYPAVDWVCGSSTRLPIADNSLDYLLRIFAPGNDQEVRRCLKDDGKLIVLSPAANHLRELKKILYEEAKLHPEPKNIESFSLRTQNQVEYTLNLDDPSVIKNLMSMTPFFWQGSYAARMKLLSLQELAVTVHVLVSEYEKEK